MGYSVRTPTWRYTEFAQWDGLTLCLVWNTTLPNALVELYDHTGDDGFGTHVFDAFENVNLAFEPAHAGIVKELGAQIRLQYQSQRCPRN